MWTDAIRSKILSGIGLIGKRNKFPVYLQGWEIMTFSVARRYCVSYYIGLFFVILYLSGDEQDHWVIGCTTKIYGAKGEMKSSRRHVLFVAAWLLVAARYWQSYVSAVRILKQLDRQKTSDRLIKNVETGSGTQPRSRSILQIRLNNCESPYKYTGCMKGKI